MKHAICLVCSLSLIIAPASTSFAQTEFKKALQKKHNLKTVSCYTCHSRKAEIPAADQAAFKANKKSFRNDFGKEFDKLLNGKNITQRLAAVKKLPKGNAQKDKVSAEATKEFLEALEQVEKVESPEGPTYGELLENGTLKGVKPK